MNPSIDWLLADGWREYPNQFKKFARCFYKQFDTPSRCRGNGDKQGIQIEMCVSDITGNEAYEIELTGQLGDGTWITLHQYSLPNDIRKAVTLIPRLLTLWEEANK